MLNALSQILCFPDYFIVDEIIQRNNEENDCREEDNNTGRRGKSEHMNIRTENKFSNKVCKILDDNCTE